MNEELDRQSTARVSVIDPLSQAILWALEVLFRPFDPGKWLVLGFCAWLAMLGQCGGPNGSANWNVGDQQGNFERNLHEGWDWLVSHFVPILIIGGFLVALLLTFWLLFLWLSSRGKFMFLDGVVRNRAAVIEPWHRYRDAATSLFGFRVIIDLTCTAIVIGFLAYCALLLVMGLDSRDPGPALISLAILGFLTLTVLMIGFSLVKFATNEFVVPLMYLRGNGIAAAWRELGTLVPCGFSPRSIRPRRRGPSWNA